MSASVFDDFGGNYSYESYPLTDYVDGDKTFGDIVPGDILYYLDKDLNLSELVVSKPLHISKGHYFITLTSKGKKIDFGSVRSNNVKEAYDKSIVFYNNYSIIGTNKESVITIKRDKIEEELLEIKTEYDNLNKSLDKITYINESNKVFSKTQIYEIERLRENNDVFGEIPDEIAKIICKFDFTKIEKDKNVTIFFDNDSKTIFFKNLKYIGGTISKYVKLFKEGYKLVFNENSAIGIYSGKSKEYSREWPKTSGYEYIDILNNISESNPDHKFNHLSLNRFNCDYISKYFGKTNMYFEYIYFSECIYETSMTLPSKEDKKSWANPNMKFTSASSRAKTYYAENDMLVGSEEEVKSHWTKSFAKEWQEEQEKEQKRLELIKPTHENPPSIYSGESRNGPGIYIEYSSNNQKAFLSIIFSANYNGYSINWWKNSGIVTVDGAYIKVDGEVWEITKYQFEGGYWTSGREIHDFWLKKVE